MSVIKKEADFPFLCPTCNKELFDEDMIPINRCDHVLFIHIWGDSDCFTFARKDFAEKYISCLRQCAAYKEWLNDREESDNSESERKFIECDFEEGDKASEDIPYFEDVVGTCAPDSRVFFYDGYHSGFRIGF
jgi:hypothetical protein